MWLQRAPVVATHITCSRVPHAHNWLRFPVRSMTAKSKSQTGAKEGTTDPCASHKTAKQERRLNFRPKTTSNTHLPHSETHRSRRNSNTRKIQNGQSAVPGDRNLAAHAKKAQHQKKNSQQQSESRAEQKKPINQQHNSESVSAFNQFPDWYNFTGQSGVSPRYLNPEKIQPPTRKKVSGRKRDKSPTKHMNPTWQQFLKHLHAFDVQKLLEVSRDPIQRAEITGICAGDEFLIQLLNVVRHVYFSDEWDEAAFGSFRDQLEEIEDSSRKESKNEVIPENLLSQLLACRVRLGDFDRAHKHLREILNTMDKRSIRRRSYCPLIIEQCEVSVGSDNATALIRSSMDLFEEMVCQQQREIDHDSAIAIINACTNDDASFPIVMDVLRVYGARELVFPPDLFEAVEKCFQSDVAKRRGWVMNKSSIDDSCVCSCCNKTLASSKISHESQDRLVAALGTVIKDEIDKSNIQHSHQEHFQIDPVSTGTHLLHLKHFLEQHSDKEVIIDGCNIGYLTSFESKPHAAATTTARPNHYDKALNRGGQQGWWNIETFVGVLEHYNAQGSPALAVIREHFVRQSWQSLANNPSKQQALRHRWQALKDTGSVYTVKNSFPDDLFVLYAAVLSKSAVSSRCKIITNDFFRDHFQKINNLNVGRDILQFQRNSQTHIKLWQKDRRDALGVVEYSCYRPFAQIAQEQLGAWHVPAANGDWMCLTNASHTPQDAKYPQVDYLPSHIIKQMVIED